MIAREREREVRANPEVEIEEVEDSGSSGVDVVVSPGSSLGLIDGGGHTTKPWPPAVEEATERRSRNKTGVSGGAARLQFVSWLFIVRLLFF